MPSLKSILSRINLKGRNLQFLVSNRNQLVSSPVLNLYDIFQVNVYSLYQILALKNVYKPFFHPIFNFEQLNQIILLLKQIP